MRAIYHGPGVQVVALVPAAGPVPPPIMVVTPETSASSACGQIQWMWVSIPCGDDLPFGGDHFRCGAIGIVAGLNVRVAGFADGKDPPVLDADIGFHDPPVIDDQRVGQHQIHAVVCGHLPLTHAVADHLPAELDLFAVDREIVFHFNPQLAVGQPHFIPVVGPNISA
jgi:hypothetical protein